jgi:hypothetical protein
MITGSSPPICCVVLPVMLNVHDVERLKETVMFVRDDEIALGTTDDYFDVTTPYECQKTIVMITFPALGYIQKPLIIWKPRFLVVRPNWHPH